MSQLHDLTALEQAAAVRAGQVSATELVDHYLERIDRWDAALGAYVTVTADLAHTQAFAAQQALAEALRDGEPERLSVLHGVPVPVKDLNVVAGVPCRLGSTVFHRTVEIDDHVVARLRAAGVAFLGKTNTPEFGLPCYTETEIAPPARTPWDLSRSAGGSSGGAAAAVAGGLAPVAHGSDGGGSIRIPASVCGLVGLKTSRGRISNGPLQDAPGDLPVHGPLARTVADAAALLDVMAGDFPGDPFPGARPPPVGGFVGAAAAPPGRLRIGRYAEPVIAEVTVDAECLATWESTSALLESLGHQVEDVPRPFGPEVVGTFENVWAALATLTPVRPEDEARLQPLTQWLRVRGRALSAPDLMRSLAFLRILARAAIAGTAPYDVLLTPTLAQLPALVGGLRDDADPAADFEAQKRFTPFTSPYNVTGQPALSLPLGWSAGGLPIGVQLIGRPGDEATLLSLGGQLEEALPWAHRHPDCW
ncbi:MAG TPA: amidase [Candidatus Limnocylindria bacterium]|nr:amidase [Candidatus Limnocylindria bacterium]